MKEYEAWLPDEMLFRKIPSDGRWTHHVHLTEHESPPWADYLLLRDYLRRHHKAASEYGDLKTALAGGYANDIAGYRLAKRSFVERMIGEARNETSS